MISKMAVLGSPIEHSLSPLIHNKAMEILGISGSYQRFTVTEKDLAVFLAEHDEPEWQGFSLTMPLKEEAFRLGISSDEATRKTQVSNTLVNSPKGWLAYNTDALGFEFLLKDQVYKSVSVLGTGGTARAALFAISKDVEFVEVYRRSSKNDRICLDINSKIVFRDWQELSDSFRNHLLINATAASANDELKALGRQVPVAIDAVYAPWPPPLLQFQKNATYFSGKDLLVAQALDQISLFHRQPIDKKVMFESLRSFI